MKTNWILSLLLVFLSGVTLAQDKFTVSGYVKDGSNGEELINATVYVRETKSGVQTNLYGYYALTLPAGTYTLDISYLGFNQSTQTVNLKANTKLNVEMDEWTEELEVVEIAGKRKDANISNVEMSKVDLNIEQIKSIPAMMGEVDVIKAIQLLPGVQSAGEGGSGFYVRGGGKDQNLIVLDEAPVYNASHLLGFFSVFNADAIKDVQLYKGGIPAEYGGRLSSMLDIRMKDGNSKNYSLTGGIGTISSRLTLEGPFQKDKSSFLFSGRRTYADMFLKLSANEETRQTKLYFYDFNGKINYKLGEKDRVFFSGYFGRDEFGAGPFGLGWGNQTFTARWNHVYGDRLFHNISIVHSKFDYYLGFEGEATFNWDSYVQDLNGKIDYTWFLNNNNKVKFGAGVMNHSFNPGLYTVESNGESTIDGRLQVPESQALESHAYVSNEQKLGSRLFLKYGVRTVWFNNVGPGTVYHFDDDYNYNGDSTNYAKGDMYQFYNSIEPRFGARYTLTETSSLKASYQRTNQFLHLMSPSSAGSMLDIWLPSSANIQPEQADQFAIGYFKNLAEDKYETSVELYYKDLDNIIGFKDHAQIFFNKQIEGEVRSGTGISYGAEFLVRKNTGKLTGWISYTLSKAEMTIPTINNGNPFPAIYDRRHDFSIVSSLQIGKLDKVGATWVYWTGRPVTLPTDRMVYQNKVVPIYNTRNSANYPAYHRMDVSWSHRRKPVKHDGSKRKLDIERVLSVYNAYNQKNIFQLNFETDVNTNDVEITKTYFPIIIALTYNFNLDFNLKPFKAHELKN